MPSTPSYCPHCGAAILSGHRFCSSCGRPVVDSSTPIPATPIARLDSTEEDGESPDDEGEEEDEPSEDPASRGEIGWRGAFFWWLIVFGAIAIGVGIYAGKEAVGGVALAAVISLVLMVRERAGAWKGRVVEIRAEQARVRRGKRWHTASRTYVYIQDDRGSVRKEPLLHEEIRVGDLVEKRRGEATYHKA